MRKVTPRVNTIDHIKEALGRTVYTNISPTMKAKLIGYDENKSYFEVLTLGVTFLIFVLV